MKIKFKINWSFFLWFKLTKPWFIINLKKIWGHDASNDCNTHSQWNRDYQWMPNEFQL